MAYRFVIGEDGSGVFSLGDQVILHVCLYGWKFWQDERAGKLAVYRFMTSVPSWSRTKLEFAVNFVILKHTWENLTLSAEVLDDGAMGSLLFDLGHL